MTSEGFGEMFEGDSEDICGGKFPLVSMGGQAQTRERGPPLALGEIVLAYLLGFLPPKFKFFNHDFALI